MRTLSFALVLIASSITPAFAMTITAKVTGGNIAVHSGPHDSYGVIARLADGTEVPIDRCTQIDSESRYGSFGDAGHVLLGNTQKQWCRIPDLGWVERSWLTGRGLVNVTPPDFTGPGW